MMITLLSPLILLVADLQKRAPTIGPSVACDLRPGLYSERVAIVDRYARGVGVNYLEKKAEADRLLAERRDIDRQYLRYMAAVAAAARDTAPERLGHCCAGMAGEPIAARICALGLYLQGGRRDRDLLTRSIPVSKETAAALWALDDIAHSEEGRSENAAGGIDLSSPVSQFLNETFALVVAGDSNALRALLSLYAVADGEYAERIEEQLETLFLDYPEIVVANRRVIAANGKVLADLRATMSIEKRRLARKRIADTCAAKNATCDKILISLR